MTLKELIAQVYAAPRGPRVAAFVGYGGTLVGVGPATEHQPGPEDFRSEVAPRLHIEMWELVEAHHRMGHTVVLMCSGDQLPGQPMADAIKAQHVLVAESGGTDGAAVRALADEHRLDLARSFGYGGVQLDAAALGLVGHPVAVAPDPGLADEAARRGWPVLRCVPRGGPTTALDRLRTAGFGAGFAAGVGAGIGVGVLRWSKRSMLDVSFSRGADFGLALAGVSVRVLQGAEYLASARPGVFVFNHQSMIDPVVVMKLVRGRLTGVGKKEAKDIPGFGRLFQFADVAFVDRGNTVQAKQALAPAVDKVRTDGLSLLIAPEGTRSATPRMGPLKKGAFHIAMQAGVPLVPMVLRHAGVVWPRNSRFIRGGTIEVVVLPPVDSSTWHADDLGDEVERVKAMFDSAFAHWPGYPSPPEE